MKKILIISLCAIIFLFSGYLFYDNFQAEKRPPAEIAKEFNTLKQEYAFLKKDLELNLNILNSSNNLIDVQKKRMEELLGKKNLTEKELEEAKEIMHNISQGVLKVYKNNITELTAEKNAYNNNNTQLLDQIANLKGKILDLQSDKNSLNKMYRIEKSESTRKSELIESAAHLTLTNFDLSGIRVKNNGKEIETDRASRINKIRLNFDINENLLANSGEKNLYIRVIDPKNTLLKFKGKNGGTLSTANSPVEFSDMISVDYNKQDAQTVTLDWENDDFEKGNYTFEVYEKTPKNLVKVGSAKKKLE